MIRKILKALGATHEQALFWESVRFEYAHCPGGCTDGSAFRGPSGRVYRSSWRSLTMQCTRCGLQWTMTVHRIAQVAAQKAAATDADSRQRVLAEIWAHCASYVEERRGRRKAVRNGDAASSQ